MGERGEWKLSRRQLGHPTQGSWQMSVNPGLFPLEHDGEGVTMGALIPAKAVDIQMRWKALRRDRSRSQDRGDQRRVEVRPAHIPAVTTGLEILTSTTVLGGCWRLALHEWELGCPPHELTAERADNLLRYRYPDVFDPNRRLLLVANRDALRPGELVLPFVRRFDESDICQGAAVLNPEEYVPSLPPRPPTVEGDSQGRTLPMVQREVEDCPGPQSGEDPDRMALQTVAYGPTIEQLLEGHQNRLQGPTGCLIQQSSCPTSIERLRVRSGNPDVPFNTAQVTYGYCVRATPHQVSSSWSISTMIASEVKETIRQQVQGSMDNQRFSLVRLNGRILPEYVEFDLTQEDIWWATASPVVGSNGPPELMTQARDASS